MSGYSPRALLLPLKRVGLLGVALAACGEPIPAADGGPSTFAAPHTPLPHLSAHDGRVLAAPQLVTVTFAGYPFADQVEALGDLMVGSSWLGAVGKEYGVGVGAHVNKAHVGAAPDTMTDAEMATFLGQRFDDGTIPAPTAGGQTVYLVYLPKTTKFDGGDPIGVLCQDGYRAYHTRDTYSGFEYPHVIIADCGKGIDRVTGPASHEFIEACTNPLAGLDHQRGYYLDAAQPDPWYADSGLAGESADLCADEGFVSQGGFALSRSWSNAGAQVDQPCVPAPADPVYYNVSAAPSQVVPIAAGASATFTLTGWSTAARPAWGLSLATAGRSDYSAAELNATLGATTIQNGSQVTLTLTAPAGAVAGKLGAVDVVSGDNGHIWPVGISVQ